MTERDSPRWPSIPVAGWQDTRDTLHLYTQVVGKIRLADEPLLNHWWNTTLYVSATGLTTSLMPHPTGPAFQIDFDFCAHRLDIVTVDGGRRSLPLEDRPVADFYQAVMSMLDELGLATPIWPVPVEIADAIPFADDRTHVRYDPDAVHRFWLALVDMQRVFAAFRRRFVGKASPVHLFWGALDLAYTRFSGRTAPAHPGGAAERLLAAELLHRWVRFADLGAPQPPSLPVWPALSIGGSYLRLDVPREVLSLATDEQCAFWDEREP